MTVSEKNKTFVSDCKYTAVKDEPSFMGFMAHRCSIGHMALKILYMLFDKQWQCCDMKNVTSYNAATHL